jgi:hypothetical protein
VNLLNHAQFALIFNMGQAQYRVSFETQFPAAAAAV